MTSSSQLEARISGAVLGVLMLLGCGKKPEAPRGETEEWRAWRQTQVVLPAAGFAPTLQGRLVVLPPSARATRQEDWCEVFLNGTLLNRFRVGPMPGGAWPRGEMEMTLRAGPNRIDLWDSTSNRHCRATIDTREGTEIRFEPTAEGYELRQTKRD